MSSAFPMDATTPTKNVYDDNSSNYKQEMKPNAELVLAPRSDHIETQIKDLNATIKSKEEELIEIKSNHSVIARELKELRSQLRLLSLGPSRFATSNGFEPNNHPSSSTDVVDIVHKY